MPCAVLADAIAGSFPPCVIETKTRLLFCRRHKTNNFIRVLMRQEKTMKVSVRHGRGGGRGVDKRSTSLVLGFITLLSVCLSVCLHAFICSAVTVAIFAVCDTALTAHLLSPWIKLVAHTRLAS